MIRKKQFYFLFFVTSFLCAQTSMPNFFGNNMVLQQNDSVPLWGTDKPNSEIKISTSWGVNTTTKVNSVGTWKTKIKTGKASFKKQNIKIKGTDSLNFKNVLIGEVWFCSGQSNMEMPMKGFSNGPVNHSNEFILNSKNDFIHLFTAKRKGALTPEKNVVGSWGVANDSTVSDFSAVGYLFAKKLFQNIKTPIGIISSPWGGTKIQAWIPKDSLAKYKDVKISKILPEEANERNLPSQIYNGMIYPFQDYKIKGFLWYQGETNRNDKNPKLYKDFMKTLVNVWRHQWSDNKLPFYFVQIAPYCYEKLRGTPKKNVALIREAQLETSQEIANSGLVVTSDVGDYDNIHPPEKEMVANRLAYWALAKQYGFNHIWFKSPEYKSMETQKNKVLLNFDFGSDPNIGLSSFGKKIVGFTIAGKDKIFYPAEVEFNKDKTLTVYSEKVKEPLAVRYDFGDCFEGTLFGNGKLPVSPFRTDNW